MADITVTCTNDKNVSIAFRWDWDNNPFHLLGLDGIYGYDCNVTTSENTTTDGSTYQGSTAKERNIVSHYTTHHLPFGPCRGDLRFLTPLGPCEFDCIDGTIIYKSLAWAT